MTAQELREKYLKFFESKGHTIIPSASLVPKETDPSVLFTTAGMHPLVPYLLGEDHPGGKRVVNVQKCIRTADIDEVGDNRHLTFFEMMGNWSFGDYFKEDAIKWSWEFLTDKKWLGLEPKRIYATVFKGENGIPRDEESINIWKETFEKSGMEAEVAGEDEIIKNNVRIIPLDAENNFWIASATGPCGPDTEMFYDTRPEEGNISGKFSDLVASGRIIEIWNNVFMEYEKKRREGRILLIDGMFCLYGEDFNLNEKLFNELGKFDVKKILVVNGFRDKAKELLKDTNIEVFSLEEEGIKKEDRKFFETLKAKYSFNYDDLIYIDHDEKNIKGAQNAGIVNAKFYTEDKMEDSLKFINENLYYYEKLKQQNVDTGMGVERTLAVLNGKENVFETELFQRIFQKIALLLPQKMEPNIPYSEEIRPRQQYYEVVSEEKQKSFRIIADHIKASVFIISDGVSPSNTGQGYVVRRLVRRSVRYGKLLGMTNNLSVRIAEVIVEMYKNHYPELEKNKDIIFEELEKEENKFRETLGKDKERNKIYTSISPSSSPSPSPSYDDYMESIAEALFKLYTERGFPLELGIEEMKSRDIEINDEIISIYNEKIKKHQDLSRTASAGMFKGGLADAGEATAKLHTATHLLLAALREILGPETYQKGSNITAERLRFDFNYPEKLTPEQLKKVEDLVNEKIQENIPVEMTEMPKDEALKIAKVSFDPSKYGDVVKVYKTGDFSIEVCGGPHAKTTGELGKFKITKEEASSAGIRRIKAILV